MYSICYTRCLTTSIYSVRHTPKIRMKKFKNKVLDWAFFAVSYSKMAVIAKLFQTRSVQGHFSTLQNFMIIMLFCYKIFAWFLKTQFSKYPALIIKICGLPKMEFIVHYTTQIPDIFTTTFIKIHRFVCFKQAYIKFGYYLTFESSF